MKEPSLGLGLTTNQENNEICKLSIPCYSFGLKIPQRLCAGAGRCLCMKSVQSLPFHKDYVSEPVCAYYGIQCLPECNCCGSKGTHCPALDDRPLSAYSSAPTRLDMLRAEDDDQDRREYRMALLGSQDFAEK